MYSERRTHAHETGFIQYSTNSKNVTKTRQGKLSIVRVSIAEAARSTRKLSYHSQINKTSPPLSRLRRHGPGLGNVAMPRDRGDSLMPMRAFRSEILDDTIITKILTK